ncbi:hypothetical protein ACIO1C_14630 [Streptomyces sp. NPDC087420]|uniref:tetratricopeptide repeat protein n=1 Tax=Streptomyces sp. NPDC087420 TaxID=3365785 RepID=UPI003837F85F
MTVEEEGAHDRPRVSTTGSGDSYRGDITAHRLAGALFTAWRGGDPEAVRALAAEPSPGPIALRCRYRHLLDTARTHTGGERAEAGPVPAPPVEAGPDLAVWNRLLVIETEGDDAVRTGDFDRAAELFRESLADSRSDAVAVANARVGLGDVHRARNQVERAVEEYEAALSAAEGAGYRFGTLRALLPLGHLALAHHSVVRARALFARASELAGALDDQVYLAGAVQGLAECDERSGDTARALEGYERAYASFRRVRTLTGQAHAAQRAGALYHRAGRLDLARDWLVRAAQDFAEDNDAVGMTNVLEGLGDILLDVGDPDAAEVQFRAAHSIAVDRGLRGARAHAAQNLARLARSRADWPAAVGLFGEAVAAYREEGDLLGVCTALAKLAESHERLGRVEEALGDRVDAVFAIEEYRAANRDAGAQQEYRGRFAGVYASALRAAVSAGNPEAFAVVADGLAGRRLAGLAEAAIPPGVTDHLTLLQHVLVSADERWIAESRPGGTGGMRLPPGISRQERINRMLGVVGLRGGLREPAEEAVDDLLAAVYLPPADDGADLLAMLPAGCHALQLVRDPVDHALLHRLWRAQDGSVRVDSVELSAACLRVLAVLREDSQERGELRPEGLTALAGLLPDPLREAMAGGGASRLLLLPVGDLWLIPWGAVPLRTGLVLGQAVEYVVCPSLVLQRVLRRRGPARPVDRPTCFWRSPVMESLDMTALREDPRWTFETPPEAWQAKSSLGDGAHTVVMVCHGRLSEGPGHYLELDTGTWLLPSDVLVATPPVRLYLITCWGAGVPGQAMTDPVSIATLALARGSTEILATVGEYGDTPVGDQFAQWVLASLDGTGVTASEAVHRATGTIMNEQGMWTWPLRDWAPLLPIGTFRD